MDPQKNQNVDEDSARILSRVFAVEQANFQQMSDQEGEDSMKKLENEIADNQLL